MNPVFLVVGPPAVGKSSTSRALAARFPRSLHVPVDDLRDMVVSGLVLPSAAWSDELAQQITLARTTATHMARSYRDMGFAVVIDDFWDPNHPSDYRALLDLPCVHKAVLYPSQAEAHRRNHQRSGGGGASMYIDEGIRIVYDQLRPVLPQLAQEGWLIVDTTTLNIDATVAEILRQAALTDQSPEPSTA